MASIPSVPLIRARPSFSARRSGTIPLVRSASRAANSVPERSRTMPSPIAARAQWARGARSPEHPSEPYSGTTGVIPAVSMAAYASAVPRRTPVRPVAIVARRSSIMPRTTSRSTSGPDPAAWERMRLAGAGRAAAAGCDGSPGHRSRWKPHNEASRRRLVRRRRRGPCGLQSAAASERTAPAPSRATATTSSNVRVPPPTTTFCMTRRYARGHSLPERPRRASRREGQLVRVRPRSSSPLSPKFPRVAT